MFGVESNLILRTDHQLQCFFKIKQELRKHQCAKDGQEQAHQYRLNYHQLTRNFYTHPYT